MTANRYRPVGLAQPIRRRWKGWREISIRVALAPSLCSGGEAVSDQDLEGSLLPPKDKRRRERLNTGASSQVVQKPWRRE